MYEDDDILTRIKSNLPTMSKGQKRMSAYIMENYDKIVDITAAKLGEIVGVSESTVVRFAAELGYDGYPKLQKALSELLRATLTNVQRMEVAYNKIECGSKKSILKTVLEEDAERIKQTINEISEESFEQAINEILSARNIYIVGGRSSAHLAEFLGFYLNLMIDNVKVVHAWSTGEMFEIIHRINDDDCIIGLSFPRYTKRTIKAMEYAKSQNATVITITDRIQSPMTAFSDINLVSRSDMVSFVDSLVAPLSVINALLVAISMQKKAEITKTMAKLENIWDEFGVYEKGMNHI